MAHAAYRVAVPGSLMLMGEHAVLSGSHALVAAVDRKLYATLTPRTDKKIILQTAGVESYEAELGALQPHPFYRYALKAIDNFATQLSSGFAIEFESELGEIGLGSSAAVTVATLALLLRLLDIGFAREKLLDLGRRIILALHGVGSGADLAASIYGGVLAYQLTPDLGSAQVHRIADELPLTVIYSGSKVPTPTVIELVKNWGKKHPEELAAAFATIDRLTCEARAAISMQNWLNLGKLMNQHAEIQEQLGLATPRLRALLALLRARPEFYGAKISGAGLGDCVIALGVSEQPLRELAQFSAPKATQLELAVSREGIQYV